MKVILPALLLLASVQQIAAVQIDIRNIDKGNLVLALYKNARSGPWEAPIPMTYDKANADYQKRQGAMDYLNGRAIKMNIGGDFCESDHFDRTAGTGKCQKAVDEARQMPPPGRQMISPVRRRLSDPRAGMKAEIAAATRSREVRSLVNQMIDDHFDGWEHWSESTRARMANPTLADLLQDIQEGKALAEGPEPAHASAKLRWEACHAMYQAHKNKQPAYDSPVEEFFPWLQADLIMQTVLDAARAEAHEAGVTTEE